MTSYPNGWVAGQLRALIDTRDLHALLQCAAQEGVVLAILDEDPGAARVAKNNGELPLHSAVSHGAAEGIVRALLAAHGEAAKTLDCLGNLPLHIALQKNAADGVVRSLLAAFPGATAIMDANGELPLQLAMQRRRERIMVAILSANAATATLENEQGILPILYARSLKMARSFLAASIDGGALHALSSPESLVAIAARFTDDTDLQGFLGVVQAGLTPLQSFDLVAGVLSEAIDEVAENCDEGLVIDSLEVGQHHIKLYTKVDDVGFCPCAAPSLILQTLRKWREGAKRWNEFMSRCLAQVMPDACAQKVGSFLCS